MFREMTFREMPRVLRHGEGNENASGAVEDGTDPDGSRLGLVQASQEGEG
jgi:hypothetical protein